MGSKTSGFLIIFISIFILLSVTITADEYYDIEGYDVDIVVHEDNTYNITEEITVHFYEPRHGIYRDIDMKYYDYPHDITDIEVTGPNDSGAYKTKISKKGQYLSIKIGDKDLTYVGEMVYRISYTYHMGEDYMEGDEFYFDIIGTHWDCWIDHISFSIDMPKDFDQSKVNFTSGYIGSVENQYVEYIIDDNKITGKFLGYLSANQGLTLAIPLEEDYFTNEVGRAKPILQQIMIVIFAIIAMIAIYYKRKYIGINQLEIEELRRPPEGLNVPETAYVVNNERVSSADIAAQVLKWAADGYITIKEVDGKGIFKSEFMIYTKIYMLKNAPSYEVALFNAFFNHGDGTTVTSKELSQKLYKDLNTAAYKIRGKFKGDKEILDNSIQNKIGLSVFLFIIAFVLYGAFALNKYATIGFGPSLLVVFMVFIDALMCILVFNGMFFNTSSRVSKIVLGIIFISIVTSNLAVFIYGLVRNFFDFERGPNSEVALLMIVFALALIAIFNITRIKLYTPYGKHMIEQVLGFKKYMESGKMADIEMVHKEKANYFYEVLPYAMVCGMTSIWEKQVKDLSLEPPDWYTSTRGFHAYNFASQMKSSLATSSSSPSSSSSGGSSGGGGGGGGGGSW